MENNNGLKRQLGLFPLTNIVIANMVGTGIFTTSGLIIGEIQNPGIVLFLWLIGGLVALCGALTYGRLSSAIPEAGGEYIFLSRLIHPAAGFLSGWVSLFAGFSAPVAASALAFYEYISRGLPAFFSTGGIFLSGKSVAIAIIMLFTAIHSAGLKGGTIVQNVLTILKVILILGMVFAGFIFGNGNADRITEGGLGLTSGIGWKSAGLCLLWIMYSYTGWNASSYLGSEVKNPERNIQRSLLAGTSIVIVIYVLMNALFLFGTADDRNGAVISIGGLAAGNLMGDSADRIVSMLIAFALVSSLSVNILLGPRVYFAMARDGYFFKSIAGVGRKSGVPVKAILTQSGLAIVMILIGSFEDILTYMGFSLGIFPLLSVFAFFRLKSSKKTLISDRYSIAPLFFLAAVLFMLIMSFAERPAESSIAIITILSGLPFYFYFNHKTHRAGFCARNILTRMRDYIYSAGK